MYTKFSDTDVYTQGDIYGRKANENDKVYFIREIVPVVEGFILKSTSLNLEWFTNEEIDFLLNETSRDIKAEEMTIYDVMALYSIYRDSHPILKHKVSSSLYYPDEIHHIFDLVGA